MMQTLSRVTPSSGSFVEQFSVKVTPHFGKFNATRFSQRIFYSSVYNFHGYVSPVYLH